jgi:hypothetical protein
VIVRDVKALWVSDEGRYLMSQRQCLSQELLSRSPCGAEYKNLIGGDDQGPPN